MQGLGGQRQGGGVLGGPPIKKMGVQFFIFLNSVQGVGGQRRGGGGGGIGGTPIKKMGVQFFFFLSSPFPFPSHLQLLDAKTTCPCVLGWGGGGLWYCRPWVLRWVCALVYIAAMLQVQVATGLPLGCMSSCCWVAIPSSHWLAAGLQVQLAAWL